MIDPSTLEQGTEEWKVAKRGFLGASRLQEVVAKTKSGWTTGRANVMAQMIAERLTGVCQPTWQSAEMTWGIDNEAAAKAAYEFQENTDLQSVGFCLHPSIEWTGASPDALCADGIGMTEFKCPLTATHLDTLLGGSIPVKYRSQCEWQMACCPERQYVDYCSFDPRLPPRMQLTVQRIHRDNARIAELEAMVRVFLAEVEAKLAQIRAKFGQK